MRSTPPCLAAALFLTAAITAQSPAQGLYWESTTSGGPAGAAAGPAKSFAVPKKFKREDANSTIIVRLDREAMYFVQPKQKTYSEVTFAELDGLKKQMQKQLEEMEKRLKDLPPEQKAIVEKQFAKQLGKKDVKVDVAPTGEKKQVIGYSATKFVGKEEGKDVLTAWTTTDIKEFDALRKDWVEVMKRMTAANPILGKGRAEAFEKVEGFPLETDLDGVKTIVTRVEKRAIPDSEFEPPEGYTKTKAPLPGADPRPRRAGEGAKGIPKVPE